MNQKLLRLTVISSVMIIAYSQTPVYANEHTLASLIEEAHRSNRRTTATNITKKIKIEQETKKTAIITTEKLPTIDNIAPLPFAEIKHPAQLANTIDLTAPTEDLWERMRHGYAMPDLQSDLVLELQQRFLNNPDYLRRVVERSRKYIHYILDQIEERGMPAELALLPMVESAYNPMAVSSARAVGLWQFIPSTAKDYNLEQNGWIDQRRDIVASTSAALDYLQTIYEMHGDWHLALASYNWGENAVARAIEKNRASGLPTDYLSLTMPNETRYYVPKLQALKNIFGNPKIVAMLDLPETPNRPYFDTIDAPANIDLHQAAKLADMPVEELIALNPAHKRAIIKENTELALPSEKIEIFKANLDRHATSLTLWKTYTFKRNDRLTDIAARFGTNAATLRTVNGLSSKANPKVGTTLLVPIGNKNRTLLDLSQLRLPSDPPVSAKSAKSKKTIAKSRNTSRKQLVLAKQGKATVKARPSSLKASSKTRTRLSQAAKRSLNRKATITSISNRQKTHIVRNDPI